MALSVVLDDLPPRTEALWAHILQLSRNLDPAAWVLVGGQMVMLHARARGVLDGVRASQDVDVLADLVVSTENYTTCARVVSEVLGHRPEPDSHGLRYRYRHPDVGSIIDLLCPDHRSPAAALGTLAIDGGFQALQRRTTIEVRLRQGETPTTVPVPDLLGASVLKAAAAVVDSREPQRHVGDLALLVSLMDDPLAERSRLKGSDRGRLLKVRASLDDATASYWRRLGTHGEHAYLNWNTLVADPTP